MRGFTKQKQNKTIKVDRGWENEWMGEAFFVTGFAPFYSEKSSRYSFGATSSFLLFQPSSSFAHHSIPLPLSHQNIFVDQSIIQLPNGKKVKNVRKMIQDIFKSKGRDYSLIHQHCLFIFADHFIVPDHQMNRFFVPWYTYLNSLFHPHLLPLPPLPVPSPPPSSFAFF